ncbi:class I SAM-dependent methyltransferase [Afipia sp. GAS231]|uniref:class I SAM-dependent methyltransferase n=1 Tax=Afipia sp. GAS231 TaxID=1882747 RepID=UPI00087D98B2|nr:class I SAM-dependent methyltransferase [Afipia sp. GAS231]SDM98015.1 Ubiquinone/menaquinone biosynthesis C-methylase UbiE [Afipia sp. GAS231]
MDTPQGHQENADQIAYWNGPGGQRWADRQAAQDILLKPIADLLIDRAKPKTGERVIDVGCGSGATTIAFGHKVAPSGHVFGIDVSGPMLERARQTAPKELPVDFALADATVYPFDPASFDLLASRFGVMFFADPALSFSNLRKALRPSGRLAFACWREPKENPFFMAPLQAVYKHVPKLPPQGPEDPGPFAFASEARVNRILGAAGFAGIAMEPCHLTLDVALGRGLEAAVQAAFEIGPASRALEGHPPETRAAATNSVREVLATFAKGDTVPLPASIWIVTARAG